MLFRIILFAAIGWFIFRIFRMLTGASRGRQRPRNPFEATRRRKNFDGKAVDADFEELDDDKNDK